MQCQTLLSSFLSFLPRSQPSPRPCAAIPAVNRRLNITRASWLLALLPLAAFVFFLSLLPAIASGTALTFSVAWMPSLGMTANLYYDSLSALFLLLVTGIGTLIIVYSGYYFKGDNSAWRFLAYMFLFMTAMVGVLLAGDVITLVRLLGAAPASRRSY